MHEAELLTKYEAWCMFMIGSCHWVEKRAMQCWLRGAKKLNAETTARFERFIADIRVQRESIILETVAEPVHFGYSA
jgi:hypothetical protein